MTTTKLNPVLREEDIRLLRESTGRLILCLRDLYFNDVQIVAAAPMSQPDRYICFLEPDGREIGMIRDMSALLPDARSIVEEELARRHVVTSIERVLSIRREVDVVYLRAATNRGPRDLIVRTAEENVRWIDNRRLLLTDVYGSRFEVRDLMATDRATRAALSEFV
jgi:Domain of unknown function (DUF1854)